MLNISLGKKEGMTKGGDGEAMGMPKHRKSINKEGFSLVCCWNSKSIIIFMNIWGESQHQSTKWKFENPQSQEQTEITVKLIAIYLQ